MNIIQANPAQVASATRSAEMQGVTNSSQTSASVGNGNGSWDSFMDKANDILLLIYSAAGVVIIGKKVYNLFKK